MWVLGILGVLLMGGAGVGIAVMMNKEPEKQVAQDDKKTDDNKPDDSKTAIKKPDDKTKPDDRSKPDENVVPAPSVTSGRPNCDFGLSSAMR